ncbi:rRNA-processing protein EBP2 [Recurvomyces mirabilis]|nr:rRNA-processing protein EBP2 [Recurvomyces mirabilis]
MVKHNNLKAALDRNKGVDYAKDKQKKLQKEAEKRKLKQKRSEVDVDALEEEVAGEEEDEEAQALNGELRDQVAQIIAANGASLKEKTNGEAEGWETDESEDGEGDEEDGEGGVNLDTFEDESDSDSDEDETFYTAAATSPQKKNTGGVPVEDEDEDDEDDEDIPISDIESLASEDKGDVIPHQRLTINNTAALQRALKSFALSSTLPFSAAQSVTTSEPVQIADEEDDLTRELAFYQQSLNAVKEARIQLKKEGVPFTRPADYFAEMVKSEEQMGKVKQKMVDEAARKKASSDARRQRDLKKFGKAVQVAKLQERDRAKRDMLDKVGALKRKRSGGAELTANEDSMFDVALEDAATTEKKDRADRRAKGAAAGGKRGRDGDGGPNRKRQKKDEKFGFGGKKKFAKSNDARSTGDMSGFSARKMKGGAKGGAKRPGKSKRART